MKVHEPNRDGLTGGIGFRLTTTQRVALDRLARKRRCGISAIGREAMVQYLQDQGDTTTTEDKPCGQDVP